MLGQTDESYNIITQEHKVLDHGFVRLDDHMASDLSVINSARVSYGMRHDEMSEGDDKLIGFLMRGRHGTPFEHNAFRFHVKAPIFIFREWQRHRIGSFNELSARYKRLEPEFYVPSVDGVRQRAGKPGSYIFEPVEGEVARGAIRQLEDTYAACWKTYQLLLDWGVAPEQARLSLPVATYSEMYWTVNARSLMNFLNLRNAPQAQWEIRQYAGFIENIFAEVMPITYKAFEANGHIAP